MSSPSTTDPRIDEVLGFWFGDPAEPTAARQRRWFTKDASFDHEVRWRFGEVLEAAGKGELDGWAATSRGALALVIVLDQFSRNIFRDSAKSFAQDAHALAVTRATIAAGLDRPLSWTERYMLQMPFMHAEDKGTQKDSVAAFQALHDEAVAAGVPVSERAGLAAAVEFAGKHAAIVERFGRFPHRNAALTRESTPEEIEFLAQPGSGF